MGFIQGIKRFFREQGDVQKLLALAKGERRFVVWSEDVASWNMFGATLERLTTTHAQDVIYVTSAADDPLFGSPPPRTRVFYVQKSVGAWLARLDSEIFFTTVPDLGQLHVKRPRPETCCLYVFHSLNSIHEVYREGAFDHYDAFFCTGPHHKLELEARFRQLGRPAPALHEVGYDKLDRVAAAWDAWRAKPRPPSDKPTILVAPSWGAGNLLEAHGIEIVARLLSLGARVIVRPHPCFFLPIYPGGRAIVDGIARAHGAHDDLVIERSIVSEDSFYEADLMLSDFSGAAFEFALGTLRPVLFVDVARKTLNANWEQLGLPTFEDTMRHQVGQLVSSADVGSIDTAARSLLDSAGEWRERLAALRQSAVYHFGRSAETGAAIIDDTLRARGG